MLKYYLITVMFALCACQTPGEVPKNIAWQYKDFNERSYQNIDENDIPSDLIKMIKKDYVKNPWREGYNEIGLISAFHDTEVQKKFLKFAIAYVHDIYVVYEVNEENEINDKFLLSQW